MKERDGQKTDRGGTADGHDGHRRRLRKTASADGFLAAMDDVRVLETLLSYLIPRKDTHELARGLIERYGTLFGVVAAGEAELSAVPDMTRGAAEVVARLADIVSAPGANVYIRSIKDSVEFFAMRFFGGNDNIGVLYLDEKFTVRGVETFRGTRIADLRRAVAAVGRYDARYVIVGRGESSLFDIGFDCISEVDSLAEVLDIAGARLLDYLIFTPFGFYSPGTVELGETGAGIFMFAPYGLVTDREELFAWLGKRVCEECAPPDGPL